MFLKKQFLNDKALKISKLKMDIDLLRLFLNVPKRLITKT
jgi:hypothetical protein